MSASTKSVLIIGLKGNPNFPPDSEFHPDNIIKAILDAKARLEKRGFELTCFTTNADDPDLIANARAHLSQKKWAAVGIGGGVRLKPANTSLLEQLVNLTLDLVSPPPKFFFPDGPNKIEERVLKQFPEAG